MLGRGATGREPTAASGRELGLPAAARPRQLRQAGLAGVAYFCGWLTSEVSHQVRGLPNVGGPRIRAALPPEPASPGLRWPLRLMAHLEARGREKGQERPL